MTGIYFELYDIIVSTLFGTVELVEWQEIVAIVLGSAGSIFVFVLPFLVLWLTIRAIFRWS